MTQFKKYKFSDFVDINPLVKLKVKEEYSFIEMKDLNDGQRFAYPSIKRTLTGGARFEENDTLFARITPCLENGKICQAKGLKDGKGFGSTEFLVFRGKKSVSESNFVFYLSRWDDVRRFAELHMVGTSGRQRVPKDVFENLELDLPEDLPTQTRISSILSSLDDKIELNRRTNHTLEQIAQTLFKKYFVDDIGPENLPEGWTHDKIGNNVNTILGGTPSTTNDEFWNNGKVAWINSGKANEFRIVEPTTYITEKALKHSNTKLLPKGTTIIAITGATMGQISRLEIDSCANQSIVGVIENEKIPSEFIYFWLKENLTEILSHSTGGAQQHINKNNINDTIVVVPKENLINKFRKIAKPIFEKISLNCFENIKLQKIRDSLLPKLMSGEIEVNAAEKELAN